MTNQERKRLKEIRHRNKKEWQKKFDRLSEDQKLKYLLMRDFTIGIAVDDHIHLFNSLVAVQLYKLYGMGAKRQQALFNATAAAFEEWKREKNEDGIEVADEHLRRMVQQVTGLKLPPKWEMVYDGTEYDYLEEDNVHGKANRRA